MRILYATDGSEASLAGARLLARLPLTNADQVTLLTVLPEAGEWNVETMLGPSRDELQHTRASIRPEVRHGFADEQILSAAETQATDLIVVGSRGLSGLTRFLVGSVAEQVVRHAHCPVLLARPMVNDLRRALLGTDGSEGAAHAAGWLHCFPLPPECELRAVTVLPRLESLFPYSQGEWNSSLQAFYQEEEAAAKRHLDALVTSFTLADRPCSAHLQPGVPADVLIDYGEAVQADLLVVGSRGLSALKRFLLGSVSEKVMRYAPASVLVVK